MEYQTPKQYKAEACRQCGTCLTSCPVMRLSPEEARREIRNLREGRDSKALRRCTTCFDCDFACPDGCNPGELIQHRFNQVYSERGLPERARYFLPHSKPNFRTYVIDRLSPREKAIIESWKDLSPADEVCYPGCNIIVTPLLTQTRALEGLDIRGALEYCCGEMYYRMGLFDQVRQVAQKTQDFFDKLGARKVTILCTAGHHMFTRVLPHFGADYSFEMESYLSHIKRRVDSGELEFKHPLNMRLTVQESCYGKQFGPEYMDIPRELLSRAGADVVEMENSRECMLCCGIGAGFSPYSAYNPLKITASTIKVMRSAKKSGAEAVVTYCSGCMQMFSTGLVLYRTALPVYHILELLGMAMGDNPVPFHARMARNTRRHLPAPGPSPSVPQALQRPRHRHRYQVKATLPTSDEFEVRFLPGGCSIRVRSGSTVMDAALLSGPWIDAPCGGEGRCGMCRVKLSGEAAPPTVEEL